MALTAAAALASREECARNPTLGRQIIADKQDKLAEGVDIDITPVEVVVALQGYLVV